MPVLNSFEAVFFIQIPKDHFLDHLQALWFDGKVGNSPSKIFASLIAIGIPEFIIIFF